MLSFESPQLNALSNKSSSLNKNSKNIKSNKNELSLKMKKIINKVDKTSEDKSRQERKLKIFERNLSSYVTLLLKFIKECYCFIWLIKLVLV